MCLAFLLLPVLAVGLFSACRSLPCELRRENVADVFPPNPEKTISLLSERTDPYTTAIAERLERTGWKLRSGTSFARGEWVLMATDVQYGENNAAHSEILVTLVESQGSRPKDGMCFLLSFAGGCPPREYARRVVAAVNTAYDRGQGAARTHR